MEEAKTLLWLSSLEGMNMPRAISLQKFFGSFEAMWHTIEKADAVPGLPEVLLSRIKAARRGGAYARERLLEKMEQKNISFVSCFDGAYPPLLKEIYDPPAGLFYRGQLPPWHDPAMAVVGSRRCTDYGLAAAEKLSRELAASGVIIVSGMARGIDSAAHKGALAAKGVTLAVLGCGVDVCYPPENHSLMEAILEKGAVLSEYPPGVKPEKRYFPQRNRIIAGLCHGLLVAEAAEKSGTRTTVEQALSENREVFAVPGSIFSPQSAGPNRLIKDGAYPAACAEDVLEVLETLPRLKDYFAEKPKQMAAEKILPDISSLAQEEKLVYACIDSQPAAMDFLTEKTGLDVRTLSNVLFELEARGYIRRVLGQMYIRVY